MQLFSLIIPTRNRSKLLMECIHSVLGQSYEEWELIIIDDGSTDNTKEVVLALNNHKVKYYYHNKEDRSASRNLGVSYSKGSHICFIDDDDLLKSEYLEAFRKAFMKIPETTILRTGFESFNESGKTKSNPLYTPSKHQNPVCFAAYNMCGVWSLCIPKQYLQEDLFPLNFPHWQDTHLILRLLAKNPFHQLQNYNYRYRIHSGRGSELIINEVQFEERAKLNVQAIEAFFEQYSELIENHLPKTTEIYLVAEKYLEYAINAKRNGFKELSKKLRKLPFIKYPLMSRLKFYYFSYKP